MKKSEHSLRDSWDIIKCLHYRIPKGGEIKKGSGNLFGEIMAKNSQIWGKTWIYESKNPNQETWQSKTKKD